MKGTYDSPCLSVCDYAGELAICQTCLMSKTEKQKWKVADGIAKEKIASKVKKRRAFCSP